MLAAWLDGTDESCEDELDDEEEWDEEEDGSLEELSELLPGDDEDGWEEVLPPVSETACLEETGAVFVNEDGDFDDALRAL